MPRSRSSRSRVTIHRLANAGGPLAGYIRPGYTDRSGFTATQVMVGGTAGLLVSGHFATDETKWAADLAGLAGLARLPLGNVSAAAVLLLPVGEVVYAATYGMGHLLIDYELVDPGFGLRFAARKLNGELRSVTRHALSARVQIDSRSLPAGGDVRAFGLAELGTVASRVIGRAVELGGTGKIVTVRCADSLNLPLSREAGALVRDLREIEGVLRSPVTDQDLELLSRMIPLGDRDRRRGPLCQRLAAALQGGPEAARLGIAWPWEHADELAAIDSVTVTVPGAPAIRVESLAIEDVSGLAGRFPGRDPVEVLRQARVTLHDEDGAVSPAIPLLKWIAFEARDGDKLFFFADGRWFTMDAGYADHVRREADRILAAPAGLTLIPWDDDWDEETYNKEAVKADGRLVLLDRRKIHTDLHRHGIEACDLLGPDGELIHVKHLRRSGDASHLFAQTLVSVSALLLDGQARAKFAERVARHSGGTRTAPELPRRIILAIGTPRPLTAGSMFTFSQVTLVHLVQQLEAQGITVAVISIPAP
jgi:uncharacterized protein (TIGR04141 family)